MKMKWDGLQSLKTDQLYTSSSKVLPLNVSQTSQAVPLFVDQMFNQAHELWKVFHILSTTPWLSQILNEG